MKSDLKSGGLVRRVETNEGSANGFAKPKQSGKSFFAIILIILAVIASGTFIYFKADYIYETLSGVKILSLVVMGLALFSYVNGDNSH